MPGQRAKHWFFYYHYLALINQGKNSISDQIKGLFSSFFINHCPTSETLDVGMFWSTSPLMIFRQKRMFLKL